jgi:ComF family protein
MGIIERIISTIAPFRCLGCGLDGEVVCLRCSNVLLKEYGECQPGEFGKIYALFKYESLAADLVGALKFERAKLVAKVMAQHMDQALPQESWDFVTYLPTSPARARQRGYDQSMLIAREFACLRDLEFSQLLVRTSHARQVGSTRNQRQTQLKNAFLARRSLGGKYILLIDDVMTTGSSLESASTTLRDTGAKVIDCAVFAATR